MLKKMFAGADKLLFERAAQLRKQQTFAEEILWSYLRTKPFGYKFRRQHPYSIFILDFYCHALKLGIEVDGSIHESGEIKRNDERRQRQLEECGLTILRFTNVQLKLKKEKVVETIDQFLKDKSEKL